MSSIIDSRYMEQKFRLCKCGVDHVIYLIEGSHQLNDAVYSAMAQCQVMDNFFLKETEGAADTVSYLHSFTMMLKEAYVVSIY